jgi:hypothetical protein
MVRTLLGWIGVLAGALRAQASDPFASGPAPRATAGQPRPPVLCIDDTTAHVAVDAEQAGDLLDWFRSQGVGCELCPRGTVCDLDRIDFGNPSPSEEQRIRRIFAAWQNRGPKA